MYRLAFYFKRPVSELNITWREFLYWQAYLDIEPPEQGDNNRTAALLAQITNMSGRSLPDRKRVKPEDFMHKPSEEKAQTEQDQKAFLQGLGGFK
jgi:hypothetical protein